MFTIPEEIQYEKYSLADILSSVEAAHSKKLWNFKRAEIYNLQERSLGSGVTIAVLNTGVGIIPI